MHDIGFELYLMMMFCGAILGAIFILYPLFEIFVQRVLWRSKKSVWQILKEII